MRGIDFKYAQFFTVLTMLFTFLIGCKDIPMPPDGGKPKDWVELNCKVMISNYGYSQFFPTQPSCSVDYHFIQDSALFSCLGLGDIGDAYFNTYNYLIVERNGAQGYEVKSLQTGLWINYKLKQWSFSVVSNAEKSSYSHSSSYSLLIRIPKIPAGFKRI